jgi:long-chain acyl-CoA synthetase
LCGQPGVREAAVVGLPDAALGQRPVGYVTTQGDDIDADEIKAAIAPALPYDLSTLTLIRLASFPMTPTGKIAKAELRERAMQAS